jgi:hypothetical protein
LGIEETLGDTRFRDQQIEPVKCAGDNCQHAWHAALFESIGILEALVEEQIKRANADPRGRQTTKISGSGWNNIVWVNTPEVALPTEAVHPLTQESTVFGFGVCFECRSIVEHRIRQQL